MEKDALTYLLCPKCQRTLPARSKERYCPNDGSRMLFACPHCGAAITSPHSRFCTQCGRTLLNISAVSQGSVRIRSRDAPFEQGGKTKEETKRAAKKTKARDALTK